MSDEDHDSMITQFQDITGQDADRSRFYLESSGWDVELALGSFYESDVMEVEDFEAARPQAEAPAPPPVAAPPSRPTPQEKPKAERAPTGASSRPAASNINTFASRFGSSKPDDDDGSSDSDGEEGQAFYAGGSETSGQQILGPKKKEGAEFVKHMFKKAKEHGAESVDPNSSAGHSAGASARPSFVGSGHTLGSESTPSAVIPGARSKQDEKPREFVLKMWQNGFSIDDGPLRAYNDQENREFLSDVAAGRIPRELVREARGGEVMVNMEDHKDKPYEQPKVTVKPFQGSGNVLGSIAPAVVSHNTTASTSAALEESEAQKRVNVDTSKPMTTLQVRLASGGRLIVKLNETNSVSDLRRYIRLVKPETPQNFSLHTTFPNKEHTDDSATLKDAGLLGAAILMRPK